MTTILTESGKRGLVSEKKYTALTFENCLYDSPSESAQPNPPGAPPGFSISRKLKIGLRTPASPNQ
jgi:hypothetical protein